jgi:hypothetical protein
VKVKVEFGRPVYAEAGETIGDAVTRETRRLMERGEAV